MEKNNENTNPNESKDIEKTGEMPEKMPADKLLGALRSEREARKTSEARIKELEAQVSALTPYKDRIDALEASNRVAEALGGILSEANGIKLFRQAGKPPLVHDPERFGEVLPLIQAQSPDLPLVDQVLKAVSLSAQPIPTGGRPLKSRERSEPEPDKGDYGKYFKKAVKQNFFTR